MFNFKCSSELLPDGVVGDGVQEDDVPGDGHVRRQVVPHVLHHRFPGHAGSLRKNVKTGVLRKMSNQRELTLDSTTAACMMSSQMSSLYLL